MTSTRRGNNGVAYEGACPEPPPTMIHPTKSHHGDGAGGVEIIVESGPHRGLVARWQAPGTYIIGRAAHAQLALVHDVAAGLEHCQVVISPGGCALRDLGGRQGTL